MSEEIKAGDIVQLKSGSPKMTVTSVGKDGYGILTVWCAWFDGPNQKEGAFPLLTVKIA